jgi:cell division GTPase FtsZ
MTVIIAVGCAGGRMVNKIISAGRIEAEYLAINTDRRVLEACLAGRGVARRGCDGRGISGAADDVRRVEGAAGAEGQVTAEEASDNLNVSHMIAPPFRVLPRAPFLLVDKRAHGQPFHAK